VRSVCLHISPVCPTGVVLRPFHSGEILGAAEIKFAAKQAVSARVLDVSADRKIIDASLRSELTAAVLSGKQQRKLEAQLKVGQQVPVVLQVRNST